MTLANHCPERKLIVIEAVSKAASQRMVYRLTGQLITNFRANHHVLLLLVEVSIFPTLHLSDIYHRDAQEPTQSIT